jgi:hypothetical protein
MADAGRENILTNADARATFKRLGIWSELCVIRRMEPGAEKDKRSAAWFQKAAAKLAEADHGCA